MELDLEEKMAVPAGFEPATVRLEGGCSIQLSYGTVYIRYEKIIEIADKCQY